MRRYKGLTIVALLVIAFLFIPLVIIAVTAFGDEPVITFPIHGFSLEWFAKALASESFRKAFILSLEIALLATLCALVIGIPAAYALSRYTVWGKKLIKNFFLSPTIVPGIVVGYALFQFVIIQMDVPVFQALLLGHFLVVLPYIIRVVGGSLEQFDYSVEEVAWSLGCNKFTTFFKIVLPNISSGIISAFLLAFINSFNNIPVSMFLSGPGITTLPASLMSYMEYNYDPTVSAVSVLLMAATIVIMFIVEKTLGISALTK